MTIQIPAAGIVKEQTFCTDKRVSIIYGYNNHGKTTILKTISQVLCQRVTEDFILGRDFVLSVYIPTNRLIVSKTQTDDFRPRDIEEFVYYQEDALDDFGLHLKRIRDYLQADQNARHLTVRILQTIFEKSVTDLSVRHSDGIENIINLFSCILWAMTWDTDLSVMTPQQFDTLISEKEICVLIDELEMFLHVNVQARLIKSLTETFPNCHFIMTTHSPLLLTRYRNLCVYNSFCTRMIGDFDKAMTVEHIETKHDHPQKIFQWKNLLCACHTCNTERSTTPCARNQYLDPTSIPDLERYFSFLPDGTIHPDSSLTSEERQKADYMIRLYRLDRKDLECERREFFKNLLESDSFSSFLEKQDLSSQNIIFLSVFTYYRRCRERYGQQGR
jgi:uncharacterized protein (TIGR02646 family)